jgi:diguanylate cyclase (GGDEF)-like protein
VAAALRRVSRATDTPARYGGEELAVVLPDTDLDGAFAAGEHVRREVESLRVPRATGAPAAGHGECRRGRGDGAARGRRGLIAAADAALYDAKRGGRNRTVRASGAPTRFVRPSG